MTDRSGFFVGHAMTGWSGGGGSLTAITVTSNTTCQGNNAYIANSASQLTFTLPSATGSDARVQILGLGTGGWQLNAASGQSIYDASTLGSNAMVGIVGTQDMTIEVVDSAAGVWIVDAGRGAVTAASPNLDPFWGNVTCQLSLNNVNTDSSGNALSFTSNLTFQNTSPSPNFTGTYYGVFDGSSKYTYIAANQAFKCYGDCTLFDGWIYQTATGTSPVLMDTRASSSSANGVEIYIDGSGKVNVFTNNAILVTSSSAVSQNTWTHVAVTRAGGYVYIWIGGALKCTPTAYATAWSDGLCYIGRNATSAANWFPGYMQQVRACTNGIARYTAPFTVPTVPWWTSGDTRFDPWWPDVIYRLLAAASNVCLDQSGNVYNLTNANVTTTAGSKMDSYAAVFNGTNAQLTGTLAFIPNGYWTFEAWIMPTRASGSSNDTVLNIGGSSAIQIYQINGGLTFSVCGFTTSAFTISQYTHVAVAAFNGTGFVFIGGAYVGTTSINTPTSALFAVGSANTTNMWKGQIEGLRFTIGEGRYAASFTASATAYPTIPPVSYDPLWKEVTCLLPLTSGVNDLSGNNISFTNTGTTFVSNPSLFGNSVASFNGSSSKVQYQSQIPAFQFPADLSIDCWVYATAYPSSGSYATIWDQSSATNSTNGLTLWMKNSAGTQQLRLECPNQTFGIVATYSFPLNQWAHVSAVRVGSTLLLFVNGALVGSATGVTAIFSDGYMSLGAQSHSYGSFLTGNIAQFRVTNGRARYTANFTPPTAAFLTTGVP